MDFRGRDNSNLEEWYADAYERFGLDKEYLEEAYKDTFEESSKIYDETDSNDLLDLDMPVAIPLFDGLHSIRNADIRKEKLYLDEDKQIERYIYLNKEEGNNRNEATIFLNPNENRLFDIITQLPYGLIDKQATGIGATYTEMHSERNSIIVVPTRALGENKCAKDPNKFLYVGTKSISNRVTSNEEITDYLNNTSIEYKKIIVVADSLWRVINILRDNGIDVYREYFLMVDEIDTLQSDNHFRPQLSDVIDYYYKFKLQRRALVSATIKEFSYPRLQGEPLTTIKKKEATKRNITLLHTNNINKLLLEQVENIVNTAPSNKILIAYNSVTDILETISKLPSEISSRCGVLCSEASYDKVSLPLRVIINSEDELSHDIVFMTCAYFAGVDIKDRCHLITVSNKRYGYSMLPMNKITQIHGRCRNGILSDTIIYNTLKDPFKYWRNYRESLVFKASKVIELLDSADKIKKSNANLQVLFNRVEPVIIREAGEIFFSNTVVPLTRKNIDDKLEVSFFNIDFLHEQMSTLSFIYSHSNSLNKRLRYDRHNINPNSQEKYFDEDEESNSSNKYPDEIIKMRVQNCIKDIAHTSPLNDKVLDAKIRISKDAEKEYYKRFKELYKYIDRSKLNKMLLDICTQNKKSYRNFKNAVFFCALEDSHPFKVMIKSCFVVGERYSSQEIKDNISPIIADQLSIVNEQKERTYVNFFTSIVDWSHPRNKYLVRGYMPKQLKELGLIAPLTSISHKEPTISYIEFK